MIGEPRMYKGFASDLHEAMWRRHWKRFWVFMIILSLSILALVLISEAGWYYTSSEDRISPEMLILAAGVK